MPQIRPDGDIVGVLVQRDIFLCLILSFGDLEEITMVVYEGGEVDELSDGYVVPGIWVDQRRDLLEQCDYVLDLEEVVYLDREFCRRGESIVIAIRVIGAENSIEHCRIGHLGSGDRRWFTGDGISN
jgi:hypothetical protein